MAAFFVVSTGCAAVQNNVGAVVSPTASPLPSSSPTPTSPLQITGATFHGGEVGVDYAAVSLTAGGGVAPYHWTVGSGALPPGLTLSDAGAVSGNPTSSGTFTFTAEVADAAGTKAAVTRKVTVAPHVNADVIDSCSTYCTVEIGCTTVCGAFGKVTGGVAPFTYTLTSGNLPVGTTLNGMSLAGTFGGQPGYLQFTVQVTDSLGATSSISPTFWMYKHISWSGTYTCFGGYNTPCQTATISFSGGLPGGRPTVKIVGVGDWCPVDYFCQPGTTDPPDTFNAAVSKVSARGAQTGGTVTVTVQGACGGSCGNGYSGAIKVVIVDQASCSASTKCTSGPATVDVYIAAG